MVNPMDRRFMMEAAQGGMAEVQLAQLAQQKGSSDAVKQYAKMLEQDHTKANDELKQVAQQKSVDLPTDVGPKHHAMMQKFQGLSGEQFDRAYVKMMVLDHKKDIKDFQRQADRGMDSDVKGFASKTLPTLQGHLKEVEQLASNKGSGSGSMGTRSRSDSGSSSSGQDSSAQPKSQNNPTPQP